MTLAECKRRIDSRELTEWIAYHAVEPIGPQRHDVAIAILCEVVARCNGAKNAKAKDFIPVFDGTQTDNQIHNMLGTVFGNPNPTE